MGGWEEEEEQEGTQTFNLHAIDGAHGDELLLEVFEVPAGAGFLEEADGVTEFFWVAGCFALEGVVSR